MLRYTLNRVLLMIPTLIGVMIIVFLLLYVAPGDPVQDMVGERADAETIARLRKELLYEITRGSGKPSANPQLVTPRRLKRSAPVSLPIQILFSASSVIAGWPRHWTFSIA